MDLITFFHTYTLTDREHHQRSRTEEKDSGGADHPRKAGVERMKPLAKGM